MTAKDRDWLRSIVRLDARATEEHIARDVIELQEDTVAAALNILEREPGVLLADEVGMGKTFQSLAIIACKLHEKPKARVLIVTPTRELAEQWFWTTQRFGAHGFADLPEASLATVANLKELPQVCRRHSVAIVPVNAFGGIRAKNERDFLLSLWAKFRRIPRQKLLQIRTKIQATGLEFGSAKTFLGHTLQQMSRQRLGTAFKRSRAETRGFRGLDDLLAEGLDLFSNRSLVRRALDRARFHAVGSLLKPFDLLVVDEAHKFKDPWTVRSQAVAHVLHRNYHRAVFLTATPFQLGVEELKQVFRLFAGALSSTEAFDDDVERLLNSVRQYQSAYDRFESAWQLVDADQAEAFRAWSERLTYSTNRPATAVETDDPNVVYLAEQARQLLHLKREYVEPSFRQWTLRSLKPHRRIRRAVREWHLRGSGGAVIPLTLFQRLRWEAMQSGHLKGGLAADLSISSSYQAAEQSRLLKEKSQNRVISAYQRVVSKTIRAMTLPHPKIEAVAHEILEATEAGEKTLVFCERNASIRELQNWIENAWMRRQLREWNEVCPGFSFEQVFGGEAGGRRLTGVRQRIPPRFHRGADELSLALTESLPFALFSTEGTRSELPRSFWQASAQFIEEANRTLSRCRVPMQSAQRPDYPLASRCLDQAVVRWYLARDKNLSRLATGDHALIEQIQRKDYPDLGFAKLLPELSRDKGEKYKVQWLITRAMFDTILSPRRPGIWIYYRRQLGRLSPIVRRLVVEAVRYFLTRREVPFLVTALQRAGGPKASSAEIRNAIEVWWQQETCIWRQSVAELLAYLPCLIEAEQQALLKDMLRSPRVVQNSLAATSRILRQNTFNAPFYPMVLIGNQTIQQGLDLHRQCRRVIHYDLRWSPTDLEQRVGRVERHGCLAERFPVDRPEGKVQIIFPLLDQSADSTLYRDVQLRERWMDFLLGHPPTASEHDPSAEPVQPLPSSIVEALQIRLNPPPLENLRGR